MENGPCVYMKFIHIEVVISNSYVHLPEGILIRWHVYSKMLFVVFFFDPVALKACLGLFLSVVIPVYLPWVPRTNEWPFSVFFHGGNIMAIIDSESFLTIV